MDGSVASPTHTELRHWLTVITDGVWALLNLYVLILIDLYIYIFIPAI